MKIQPRLEKCGFVNLIWAHSMAHQCEVSRRCSYMDM